MKRFEIREQEPSALQRRYGVEGTVFVVWDNERGMRVPFGNYRTREQAEKRLARQEELRP